MTFSEEFLREAADILRALPDKTIEKLAETLAISREAGGRLFIAGVGGSAGSAGHAVNDFRKLCNFETYAPTDNVSELTARTNDEGWATTFSEWLRISRIRQHDVLMILSVGGGDKARNISPNIVAAIDLAKEVGATVTGIVGREGGYTAELGDVVVVIPPLYSEHITPMTEAFAAIVWHLLVSHPLLKTNATKWEGAAAV